MRGIQVKNFGISFGNMEILKNLSFDVKEGEIVTILGPSGSGKSTILRSIASLQTHYEGEIYLNETCLLNHHSSCHKEIGYIFQDYALFPHLNVKENIGFALYSLSKVEKQRRVDELLKQFDLVEHRNKQIHELSGGQQQRVSIARVIAYNPRILLLDEPFSNLDSILRNKTKLWLKDVIKNLGLSAILVTHDQKEALSISDKIGVIQNKTLVQFSTPQELYHHPINLYVAKFLGDINILPKEVVDHFNLKIKTDQTPIIRTHHCKISQNMTPFKMCVDKLSYCGDYFEVTLTFQEIIKTHITLNVDTTFELHDKKNIYLEIDPKDILLVNTI
ncbi:MAG: ABC transporter ATP-binding protein [Candidatus Marinarcus sp.]|uniref:ABC transporter ATP-binding protein n=1 Tax=Candidatus Marinarcus sp. TaxID=3100987 RepID=UPI003B009C61